MHDTPLIPVIISGGTGSRLWPLSRENYPKPFISFPEIGTLIHHTYRRAARLSGAKKILTITNRDLFSLTVSAYTQLEIPDLENIFLLEPFGRDTGAAIALALAYTCVSQHSNANLLILPADHLIQDENAFEKSVERASTLAKKGHIVTFGAQPTRPETGFGYLETQGEHVLRFIEKPDLATAETYVASGTYYWNSGIFCFSVNTMLNAMQKHCPDILNFAQEAFMTAHQKVISDYSIFEIGEKPFSQISPLSIDYAVMEKASNVACVPISCGWSDIGSWTAVSELFEGDEAGNHSTSHTVLADTKNCFVHSEDDRLVTLVGVSDLFVVDTPDALLIAQKDKAQSVKTVYNQLKAKGNEMVQMHRTAHRPWGTYTILDEGERFKVKRILVHPKQALSLQAHHHRSEHWVIVAGTALVTNGDEERLLTPNQSVYIPCGHKHRLKNLGLLPLILIEIQTGDDLGEEDIIRFEDVYGRV